MPQLNVIAHSITAPERRWRSGLRWLTVIVCLFSAPAWADDLSAKLLAERLAQEPQLSDFIQAAYQFNPMIKARREEWRQALEEYRLNTAYPDPQILGTYWPESVADDLAVNKFELMVSQAIPFPGKLSASGRAALARAHGKKIALNRAARDIMIKVRESYHELQYMREAQRISGKNQEFLAQIRLIAESSYSQNQGLLMDVMKAHSQAAQSSYDRLLLEELEQTELARLNALLNRKPLAPVGRLAPEPLTPLTYSLAEIFVLAEKNREEIRLASVEIELAQAEADMARFDTYPEFMVGVIFESSQPQAMEGSRETMWGFQFGMSLPVWPHKNAGRTAAAKAVVATAKAMRESQISETGAMVREICFRLLNAQRLVVLYRDELIPQTAQSLEIADAWNRQNQTSLADYLEIQSVWYNFQLALARASADYGKYLAQLEGLAGQRLTEKSPLMEPVVP